MKSPIIITAVFVVLVCLLAVGQAKDYKEMLGPYEVSFTLPNDVAVEMNKTTMNSELLDGTPFDRYLLMLNIPETDHVEGVITITCFNMTDHHLMIDESIDGMKALSKEQFGYTTFHTAHRVIDGQEGLIIDELGSDRYTERYEFGYQLNTSKSTSVSGSSYLPWEGTLELLKSLHVEEAK